MSVSNIMEKRMNGFHEILRKVGHEAGNTLEHLRDLAVNPLNPGSIFIFLDPCLLVILWENG